MSDAAEVKPQVVALPDGSSGAVETSKTEIVQVPVELLRKKGKPRGRPFVPGDPRINRKGTKLKPYMHLQALAQNIGDMKVKNKSDGKMYTVNEVILLGMAQSKDFRSNARFLEIEFGKIPEHWDITSDGEKLVAGMSDREMADRVMAIFTVVRERMAKTLEEESKG